MSDAIKRTWKAGDLIQMSRSRNEGMGSVQYEGVGLYRVLAPFGPRDIIERYRALTHEEKGGKDIIPFLVEWGLIERVECTSWCVSSYGY